MTRRRALPHLIGLLCALRFSGAQASALTSAAARWRAIPAGYQH